MPVVVMQAGSAEVAVGSGSGVSMGVVVVVVVEGHRRRGGR